MNRIVALLAMLLGTVISAAAADAPYRHVVLFKFKDGAPAADIAKVEQAFVALKKSIPEIQALEWGTNVSPEGLASGFTHCFFVTFKDKAALERYLPHPEHKQFGAQLKGLLDKVLVVDYVAR
ncbi:MAG: Dabb family protein [Opitutaceae bacterium]